MAIPVAPMPPVGAPASGPFSCTLCGDCCRNLKLRPGAPDWPSGFSPMARMGYYPLATEGGLQAWSWERHRMLAEAAARGMALRVVPSLVIADDVSGRLVALVYELDHVDCPFLGPGPGPDTLACGAYEARPLVCRAFPVVVSGGMVVPSSKCPVIVQPANAKRDEFITLFGDSFLAAEASGLLTREVARLLAFLEEAGVMRRARDLSKEQVLMRLERAPPLDLWDVLEGSGVIDTHEWWGRLNPDPRYVFTPAP